MATATAATASPLAHVHAPAPSSSVPTHDLGLSAKGPTALTGLVDRTRLFSAGPSASRPPLNVSQVQSGGVTVAVAPSVPGDEPPSGPGGQTSDAPAGAAGATGAAGGDSYCCPCLKACFDRVWAAVKWFFNMIAEWFMNLCCPKSGAQLLKQNEALADLLSGEQVSPDAVREAFLRLPGNEQLRIADEAYKNFFKGNVENQVPLSPEKALDWLLDEGQGNRLVLPLRRLLDSAATPSGPIAPPRPPLVLPNPARARELIRANEGLIEVIAQTPADFCNRGMMGILERMPVADRQTIALAVWDHFAVVPPGTTPEQAYTQLVSRSWEGILACLREFLSRVNGRAPANSAAASASAPLASPRAADASGADRSKSDVADRPASAASAAAAKPAPGADIARAKAILASNERLVAMLDPSRSHAPSKDLVLEALSEMSVADQETLALVALNQWNISQCNTIGAGPTGVQALAHLKRGTNEFIVEVLRNLQSAK